MSFCTALRGGVGEELLTQLLLGDFLHLVYRDGAVNVHGGLVGLVAKEVLYPLS